MFAVALPLVRVKPLGRTYHDPAHEPCRNRRQQDLSGHCSTLSTRPSTGPRNTEPEYATVEHDLSRVRREAAQAERPPFTELSAN